MNVYIQGDPVKTRKIKVFLNVTRSMCQVKQKCLFQSSNVFEKRDWTGVYFVSRKKNVSKILLVELTKNKEFQNSIGYLMSKRVDVFTMQVCLTHVRNEHYMILLKAPRDVQTSRERHSFTKHDLQVTEVEGGVVV